MDRDHVSEPVVVAIARHAIASLDLLAPGERVLVALSGGPDSVVLLHTLLRLGHPVVAAHLDHATRPESARDAQAIAERCQAWGVPLVTERLPEAPGSEDAMRRARYAFLERVARGHGCGAMALGHHADDQAETLLFRLARGTGLDGLGGMAPARQTSSGLRLIRPLLEATRAEVLAALVAWDLTAVDDPSNADPRFSRNRLRRDVIPALTAVNAAAVRHMTDLARLSRNQTAEREEETARLAKYALNVVAHGVAEIDREVLTGLPAVTAGELLRWLARRMGATPFDRSQVTRLQAMAEAGHPGQLEGGWRVETSRNWLVLSREATGPNPTPLRGLGEQHTGEWGWAVSVSEIHTETPDSPVHVRFDMQTLPKDLVWRSADPDEDAFLPWGHTQEHSLRHFLNRAEIPRHRQASMLVLASQARVLWVVGVRRGCQNAAPKEPGKAWEMQATARLRV